MDTHSSLAGPFALGTFAAGDREFAGLVAGDRVLDLTGSELPQTTRGLLEQWDQVFPRLQALAAMGGPGWTDLAELRVLAPVEPRQIFQSNPISQASAPRIPVALQGRSRLRARPASAATFWISAT
jgi:hypothetical protein